MAAKPTVGYLGMGIMGSAMAGRLVDAGFSVTVWNRSSDKCSGLQQKGAKVAKSACEVVSSCDIVFACLSDPAAAKDVVFGSQGVLEAMKAAPGRKYVDMSTVDEATAIEIGEAITSAGGHYLEAPVSGSKGPALQGQLVILAAGDKALKEMAQPCFDVMGKITFFLSEKVGAGARMKLVVNMIMGINMVALSEGLAVGQKAGLEGETIMQVIKEGAIASPMYGLKGPKMLAGDFDVNFPLKHQQKDVRLAVELGDKVNQPLPLAAAANEAFKKAMAAEKGDLDFSAVYTTVQK